MTPLQQAAKAVITRWDSPLWKDQPHTAEYVNELRKALDSELAQSVEPVAYWIPKAEQFCLPPKDGKKPFAKAWEPLYLHPPQQVAVPSGERAELIEKLRNFAREFEIECHVECIEDAADMLEADAQQAKQVPLSDDQIANWYSSENGLEDCSMCKYDDFEKVVRAVERRIGGEV